jgi:hypothetical protein
VSKQCHIDRQIDPPISIREEGAIATKKYYRNKPEAVWHRCSTPVTARRGGCFQKD